MEEEIIPTGTLNATDADQPKIFADAVKPFLFGLEQIGACFLLFGLCIYMGWTDDLAPRVANRPKNVVKNAMVYHLPNWMKGPWWYPISWIVWAYNLSYTECLKGIPGTGTRKDGFEGPLLKTNLDAVILLRFHTLMFKVSVLVMILCLCVILPVNFTAGCNPEILGEGTCASQNTTSSVAFFRTTIVNVPDKIFNDNTSVTVTNEFDASELFSSIISNVTIGGILNSSDSNGTSAFVPSTDFLGFLYVKGQTLRVSATWISCMLIYLYTLYLLTWEWIENVELRRKYFLEATHYAQRMSELNKLAHRNPPPNSGLSAMDGDEQHIESYADDESTSNRPEYLTHPEIRETPPSIGVFSVLYQLPKSMVTFDTEGATTLERQLVATTNFFDEIIPPVPGFSSSVAAVTAIPDAGLVAKVRKKWEVCEQLLQELRYVRKLIRSATEQQASYERLESERQQQLRANAASFRMEHEQKHGHEPPAKDELRTKISNDSNDDDTEMININTRNSSSLMMDGSTLKCITNSTPRDENIAVFRYEDFNVAQYASSIGFHEEVHDMADFVDGMGIEEFNVFAYKCAMLADGLGVNKRLFKLYGVETLREREQDIMEELRKANQELLLAREKVALCDSDVALDFDATNTIRQPSAYIEEEREVLELFGDCESGGQSVIGVRQRKTTASGNGSVDQKLSPADCDNPSSKSRHYRTNGFFECLWFLPRRMYFGIEGRNKIVETKKYYGLSPDDSLIRGKAFVTDFGRPSYVVVTFTTRYAAVIARQCLADGAARNSWKAVDQIPVYPLADTAPYNIGQMLYNPVTPTIAFSKKKARSYFVYIILIAFTAANTAIVQWINDIFLNPTFLDRLGSFASLAATLSGVGQSVLFSVSPYIMTILANCDGSSTSVEMSQHKSIIYFWYFYVIARFLGQITWEVTLKILDGSGFEEALFEGITKLARIAPTTLGPSNLFYIISQFTIVWPYTYFLPLPLLVTKILRLSWINRKLKGGGRGTEVPYRIYVDSGFIFAITIALAPLCPLIAPFSFFYNVFIAPMLRWLLVFGYRPAFDGGGDKWPYIHHMIITSLLLGQLITGATFVTKGNLWEGITTLLCMIPTLVYNSIILERYTRPFQDAALLQSRRMYSGTDDPTAKTRSWLQREEYRRWLVDCHKASYLPTCLSGAEESLLTTEPAIVLVDSTSGDRNKSQSLRSLLKRQDCQKGGILRRQQFNIN